MANDFFKDNGLKDKLGYRQHFIGGSDRGGWVGITLLHASFLLIVDPSLGPTDLLIP